MTHKKITAGFTLIELLVVIAIIGILSSVVLTSLNVARSKGGNAAVKANLDGVKSQAEIVNRLKQLQTDLQNEVAQSAMVPLSKTNAPELAVVPKEIYKPMTAGEYENLTAKRAKLLREQKKADLTMGSLINEPTPPLQTVRPKISQEDINNILSKFENKQN